MGGRSRPTRDHRAEQYGFVRELSDDRLERYGRYSSAAYQNNDGGTTTQRGIPKAPENLNIAASDEYIRRTGLTPDWDLRQNGGVEHHRQTVFGKK